MFIGQPVFVDWNVQFSFAWFRSWQSGPNLLCLTSCDRIWVAWSCLVETWWQWSWSDNDDDQYSRRGENGHVQFVAFIAKIRRVLIRARPNASQMSLLRFVPAIMEIAGQNIKRQSSGFDGSSSWSSENWRLNRGKKSKSPLLDSSKFNCARQRKKSVCLICYLLVSAISIQVFLSITMFHAQANKCQTSPVMFGASRICAYFT